jgi:hypothetical protein
VLANGQTEDISGSRQSESVDGDIVGGNGLFDEWELLEDVWLEYLAGCWVESVKMRKGYREGQNTTSCGCIDLISS